VRTNILGDVAAQLRGTPPSPLCSLAANGRTAGQRRWRRAFSGIITVANARRLSEIDARSHNQPKGAARRRARAAARRQTMPTRLRYVDPETRFLMEGPRG
jgi:hypothetical protein